MKIDTEILEDHQVKINAEFEMEDLEIYRKKASRVIAKKSKIPGFRPGKAPYKQVVQHVGLEVVDQQAIEMLIDDKYPEILDEIKVNPYGPGSLEEITQKEPPHFIFKVPLNPEVTLPEYHSIRKEYKIDPVSDDEVDKVIKDIQTRYATAEPSESPVELGDLVYIKLSGNIIDSDDDSDTEVVKDASLQVVIGGNELDPDDWPFEGFTKELIGLSEQDTKEIVHSYDDDTTIDKLKNKKVQYDVIIESIKKLVFPELDEEFVKTLGEYSDVDDFKNKIKDQLSDKKANEYDLDYHSEILDLIVKDSTIKYPPQLLEEEKNQVIHSLEDDLARQKMDIKTYLKTREMDMNTFLEEEIKPAAISRLERALVLDKISIEEKIELDKDELQNDVTETLEELERIQGFSDKPNQEKQVLKNRVTINIANRLINTKIFDRLKDIATGEFEKNKDNNNVSEETITIEDSNNSETELDNSNEPIDSENE